MISCGHMSFKVADSCNCMGHYQAWGLYLEALVKLPLTKASPGAYEGISDELTVVSRSTGYVHVVAPR